MKTKFKILGVIITLLLISYMKLAIPEGQSSDVFISNVEALGAIEESTGRCMYDGPVLCPSHPDYVYLVQ